MNSALLYPRPASWPTNKWLVMAGAILLGAGVGVVSMISPKLGLGVSVLVLLFAWIQPKPERGLYIIVALLPFEELTSLGANFSGVKAVTLVVFIAWLLRLARTGYSRVDLSQLRYVFLLIFLAFVFLSLSQAFSLSAGLTSLFGLVSLVFFYFLVIDLVATAKILTNVLRVLVFASIPAAIIPITEFLRFGGRAGGAGVNPNDSALNLIIVVPLVFALLASQGNRRTWQKSIYWIILGLLLAGSVVTFSRGGLIALGAIFILISLFGVVDARTKKIVASGLVGLFTLGAFLMLSDRRFSLREISVSQGAGRLEFWTAARWMFGDHWLTGVGLGNFREVVLSYITRMPWVLSWHVRAWPTHNLFVQVAVETGVFGILFFLGFLSLTFAHMRNVVKRNLTLKYHEGAAMYSMLMISLAGLLIGGLSKDLLLSKIFWLILALSSTQVGRLSNSPAGDGQGST